MLKIFGYLLMVLVLIVIFFKVSIVVTPVAIYGTSSHEKVLLFQSFPEVATGSR